MIAKKSKVTTFCCFIFSPTPPSSHRKTFFREGFYPPLPSAQRFVSLSSPNSSLLRNDIGKGTNTLKISTQQNGTAMNTV